MAGGPEHNPVISPLPTYGHAPPIAGLRREPSTPNLAAEDVAKVRDWLIEHDDESPELLAAIDQGLRSLEEKGARVVTRDELENKLRAQKSSTSPWRTA